MPRRFAPVRHKPSWQRQRNPSKDWYWIKNRGDDLGQEYNVGFNFLERARGNPDAVALCDEEREVTFGEIANASVSVALHLQHRGIRQGNAVAVHTDDLLVVFATIFATALLGCRWVFGEGNNTLLDRIGVEFYLDTDPNLSGRSRNGFLVDETWARPPAGSANDPAIVFPGYRDPDEVWMISKTSGTTGTPKLVGLSPKIVSGRIEANRARFDRPGMRISDLFPIGAPGLLSRYLSALFYEVQIVSSYRPDSWINKSVDLVFGSPAQFSKVMQDRVLARKLPMAHLSGAAGSDQFVRHLLKSFETIANGYGSTEAHNCMSIYRTMDASGTLQKRTELRDVQVQIVDENDLPLPVGVEGIVRVKNAYLAKGYLDAPAATAASFRGGWFYPGDLGIWATDGNFQVTGRINDQFNLGGVKLNASLLDFTLQNVTGIKDAICFVMPMGEKADRLTAFITIAPGYAEPEVMADARIALIRVGGKDAVPERFLFADKLPRNANGKADRRACVGLVQQAKLGNRAV